MRDGENTRMERRQTVGESKNETEGRGRNERVESGQ